MTTLLLIEEDQPTRRMLDMPFREPHECYAADGAEQALNLLEFQGYERVISNISMPALGAGEIVNRPSSNLSVVSQGKMTESVMLTVPDSDSLRLDDKKVFSTRSLQPSVCDLITNQSPQALLVQQLILQRAAQLDEICWNGACPWITHRWTANRSSRSTQN